MEGIDVRWFQLKGGSATQFSQEFLEREAARFSHVPWTVYCQLDGLAKAELIAFYRLSRKLEQVLAEIEARKASAK